MVRSAAEMAQVVADNPFAEEPGNRVVAIFLDEAPPKSALTDHKGLADERIALGRREIYIHYPGGQGPSKLIIPAAKAGTARNMNTVVKLGGAGRGMTGTAVLVGGGGGLFGLDLGFANFFGFAHPVGLDRSGGKRVPGGGGAQVPVANIDEAGGAGLLALFGWRGRDRMSIAGTCGAFTNEGSGSGPPL